MRRWRAERAPSLTSSLTAALRDSGRRSSSRPPSPPSVSPAPASAVAADDRRNCVLIFTTESVFRGAAPLSGSRPAAAEWSGHQEKFSNIPLLPIASEALIGWTSNEFEKDKVLRTNSRVMGPMKSPGICNAAVESDWVESLRYFANILISPAEGESVWS